MVTFQDDILRAMGFRPSKEELKDILEEIDEVKKSNPWPPDWPNDYEPFQILTRSWSRTHRVA